MSAARILIVEDGRIVARDIEQQLQRIGHVVIGVSASGEEAVTLAERDRPDLVLMDIRLDGDMDGIEAAQRIRDRHHIPIIFLTAYADDETLRRASVTEPLGYLLKPFDDSQLRTAVELALYKHAAERRLQDSERRYAVTLSSIGDGIIATDERVRVTFMNPVAESMTGYSSHEVIGRPLAEVARLIGEDTRQTVEDPAARVLRLGQRVGLAGQTLLVARSGREIPIEDSGAPIIDDRGNMIGAVLVFRDVSERRQARLAEALGQANSRLELALRGSETGVWDFDLQSGELLPELPIYSFNTWGSLGYEEGEVTGTYADRVEHWHPDDRERVQHEIAELLGSRATHWSTEVRVRHKDGSYRWMLARGVVVRDEHGAPSRFIGTTSDVTERRKTEEALREANARVDRAVRGSNICIWELEFDANGKGISGGFISNLWEQLGYERRDTWPSHEALMRLVHPEDLPGAVAMTRAYLSGGASDYETELRVRRHDGSYRWMLTRAVATRTPDGRLQRLTASTMDITEHKRLEESLRQAKELAEAGSRAKDEFLANVSHEIRTPMNAILGMTELVLDTKLSPVQRGSLDTVYSAAKSLLGIINDLLDFSKIEAGRLTLEHNPLELRATLGEVMRALAARAHHKRLELLWSVDRDVPDMLSGDVGRLRQILFNLVDNAIKFTEAGEVSLSVARQPSTARAVRLVFRVNDTGIGILPEKQEAVFRAFEQQDTSTTRKYGGTGLGLTIAARLAALMSGRIDVESEPGRGSTFLFSAELGALPGGDGPNGAALGVQALDVERALHGLRVLVVDDHPTVRRTLSGWLSSRGARVTLVDGASAALEALGDAAARNDAFDAALLDAPMQDPAALALVAQIRVRSEHAATRVVLLVADDRLTDLGRLSELGVDAHLMKPVDEEELCTILGRLALGDAAPPPPSSYRAPSSPPPRPDAAPVFDVLVAEDNPFNAELMNRLLCKLGHRVTLALDGQACLAALTQCPVDLVFLDLHMPELDGFMVVREIRARERAGNGFHSSLSAGRIPVIAVTARARAADRELCLAAGMDDVLVKPIPPPELAAAIDRARAAARARHGLLSPGVILAACGGDPDILSGICAALQAQLPESLRFMRQAIESSNAPALRARAHRTSGMLAAFSTYLGERASTLEDQAAAANLEAAAPTLGQLEQLCQDLLLVTPGLDIEQLKRAAREAEVPGPV